MKLKAIVHISAKMDAVRFGVGILGDEIESKNRGMMERGMIMCGQTP